MTLKGRRSARAQVTGPVATTPGDSASRVSSAPRDRDEASTSDHFNNLWAQLRATHLGRVLEQAIRDSTH